MLYAVFTYPKFPCLIAQYGLWEKVINPRILIKYPTKKASAMPHIILTI